MSDIDTRLDEILDPPAYGFSAEFSCPECMFDFKEAKQAIKQLMAEEFEKAKIEQTELIRDRFVRDGWEYKWLTEIIDELRLQPIK